MTRNDWALAIELEHCKDWERQLSYMVARNGIVVQKMRPSPFRTGLYKHLQFQISKLCEYRQRIAEIEAQL